MSSTTPTVLITGASEGIGKAIAHNFADHGYNLVLAARHRDRLEATATELRQHVSSIDVLPIPTDVREATQVNDLIHKALAQFGAIDVLVNNAGIYISGPVEEFSLEDWQQTLNTNLWGYIHTIHALLPHLIERGSGTIVNIGSIGGKVPLPYLAPYTTSKFAITGLTEALHAELAPKGIHVGGIYPNLIKSNFLERAIFRGKNDVDVRDRRQQIEQLFQVPLIETPKDVANAVWDVVENRRREAVVGSAKLAEVAHRTFPQAVQWVLRKTFQNRG